MEQSHRSLGRIAPVGLHIGAQETGASRIVLQADLVRMQLQFFVEKPPDLRHQFLQMVPAFVYDVEIIDITSVMFAAQVPLHVLVQSPQINVAEKLRGQIADRQSYTFRCLPQAFRRRQPDSVRLSAPDFAVLHRVAEYDPMQQKIHQIHIQLLLPTDSGRRQGIAAAVECPMDNIVQPLLGDTHEVTFQVELQNIGIARIVVRATAYVVPDASDPFARTFAFATGVAVEDHACLEQRRQIVEQQMVHDSVPELRSENFSFYRFVHDETRSPRP